MRPDDRDGSLSGRQVADDRGVPVVSGDLGAAIAWSELGEIFRTNWNRVYHAVKWAVSYGLVHRNLDGITAVGAGELAYLMKADFHQFWEYTYPGNAGKFFDGWCRRVTRSRIEPMKKLARSLPAHRAWLLHRFAARKQFSSGIVEGMNNKLKTTARKSYGFGTQEVLQVALYHLLADLPLPPITRRFR